MYLVAIAWIYVVLMMAVAEATSPQGSLLGAVVTFALYGVLPLSIVMYLLRTPMRRQIRRQAEAQAVGSAAASADRATPSDGAVGVHGLPPDRGDHPAGDTVAPVRKEP